jgi:hypothetical protein
VHLHRLVCHVEADRTVQAVRVPLDDIALFVPTFDEAVLVAVVPGALAAAEAGHVAENLGMLRREAVRGAHDFRRTRWHKSASGRRFPVPTPAGGIHCI